MTVRLLLALALLVLTAGAQRQNAGWAFEPEASRIGMSVRAAGATGAGRFGDWRGDLTFDPTNPSRTRATVVVQAGSLTLRPAFATPRAIGSGFLDAQRHPTILFDLKRLEPVEGDRYTAHADLTMKGITHPVSFPVDLRVTGDRAHMTGGFKIDRKDYGVGTSSVWNGLVARHVEVQVSLTARRG